ncbi:MAG: response regulator [Zoogloea sp.]|nr:response regulator [Zoogloea sp.]
MADTILFRLLGMVLVWSVFGGEILAADTPAPPPPRTISVVFDDDFPPYSMRDANGELQGILRDRWMLWQARTGIAVDLRGMDWGKAQEVMGSGGADVIDTISRSPAREKIYDFSAPYADLPVMLFFHNSISGIVDAPSSKGFVIGVKRGDICIEKLRAEGSDNFRFYPGYASLISAAANQEVRVFCMNQRPADYFLQQSGLTDFRRTAPMYTSHFQWAVAKGNSELQRVVADGFARITPAELAAIDDKWFGAPLTAAAGPALRYVAYGVFLMLAVVLGLVGWNRSLRRRVSAKTEALQRALDTVEAARRDVEEVRDRLVATLEALPDLFFEFDVEGRYLAVRATRHDLLAAPESSLVGRSVRDVLAPEAAQTVCDALAAAEVAGNDYGRVIRIDIAGLEHWFELSVTRQRVTAGERSRFIVLSRDITERRQAELDRARYREHLEQEVALRTADLAAAMEEEQALFDSASVGIMLTKGRGIERNNRRLDEMLGYASGEQIGMPTRHGYAREEDWLTVGEKLASLVPHGGIFSEDLELKRKDGSLLWARVSARAIDLANPDKGMACVVEDISVEHAASAEMAKARELAEDAVRVKSDFLANMSHEIRTPMNAIVGMAYLTLRTELNERQRDYLEKIQSASQHLLGIINDILDISKIEAGKMVVEHIAFELERVLDNVTGLVAEKTAAKGLELIVDVASDVPNTLVGDPLRLGQVLINFANNAVKFTASGEVMIRVGVVGTVNGEVMLRFAVSDTGIGIAEDQRGRLFRSFEQADTSTTRKYGGTGLGLVISKRLAELMGGEVGVDSIVGVGSTFWFTARLRRGEAPSRRFVPQAELLGRRMLVVDDNIHARDVLGEMLRRMSFSVCAVESGAAALEELTRAEIADAPYAVVFLDWQMPGRDGISTAADIHELGLVHPPQLVMVTAYGRDELLSSAERMGIRDVLMKPVTASLIFDTVVRLLGEADIGRVGGAPDKATLVAPTPELGSIAGARILLVEDNDLNQQVATEMLCQAGLVVEVAENGAIALEKLAEADYDLVLMDMQMPVMDGLTATAEIRRQPRFDRLPVVAMTANAMAGDRERCLAAGMQDHVAKPIQPAALWGTLLHWIKPREAGLAPVPVFIEPAPDLPEVLAMSTIAGLDTVSGVRNSLGREALYLALIGKFVAGQRDLPAHMASALAEGDWTSAERLVHTLKGVAAQIGAYELSELAVQFEKAIRRRASSVTLEPMLAELARRLTALIDAMVDRMPAAPAESTPVAVDRQALQAVCARLAAQLADDDFASSQTLEASEGLLRAGLGHRFPVIADAVRSFDFAAALASLQEATSSLDITL